MMITIKDIAKIAGVSHSTVSRALSGHSGISKETTDRIKKIASDIGYVPSAVARGLKTSRSNALGVIVNRIDDPFFSEILQGIEDVLQEAGYSLFVAASNRDSSREKIIVQAMRERRVDGIIVCTTQFCDEHRSQLEHYGFPIIAIGNHEESDYRWLVYHDDFYGSVQITKYLIELGHKKIAYLGNARAESTTQGRLNGLMQEMNAVSLPIPDEYIFQCPNGKPDGGEIGAKYCVDLVDPPTAIMCFNDMMAIGAIKALREAGKCVPIDFSVVGFDDVPFSAYTYPTLTTFEQPKYQLGYEAAQMMYKFLQSQSDMNSAKGQTLMLRGELIVRETTAPPSNKMNTGDSHL
ncbi:MAG: LacI family DNA-binding transcriptional regulator [Chloroflexota bacterium]|nr:LacI family DNA-binding transcriptional regulator [Chloroflexota bacterium]